MDRKKTFVTLFRKAANVHLIKDVGQIPYQMAGLYGYDATLVSNRNGSYDYLKTENPGLKMEFLEKGGRIGEIQFSVIGYLMKNAKKIDVLNLYFADMESFIYGWIYKALNPGGFLYVKLDFNIANFHKYGYFIFSEMKLKKLLFPLIEKIFIGKTDLFTIETAAARDELIKKYPSLGSKLVLLPNGVDDRAIERFGIKPLPAAKKENIILTVGRIGTYEKHNEMLMEAAANIDLKKWKVVLVGPIEKEFEETQKEFFKKRPDMKGRIIFTGAVNSREKLLQWYNRSKIFCMTSRWEAFSLVLPEAMFFGNYPVLTSAISCAPDVTRNGKLGKIVPRDGLRELEQALQELIDRPSRLSALHPSITRHARENYVWSRIVRNLQKEILARSPVKPEKKNERP